MCRFPEVLLVSILKLAELHEVLLVSGLKRADFREVLLVSNLFSLLTDYCFHTNENRITQNM